MRACGSSRAGSGRGQAGADPGAYIGCEGPLMDSESNRFSGRLRRYAQVGANVGGVAARFAGARFLGLDARDPSFWRMGLRVIEQMIDELERMDGEAV